MPWRRNSLANEERDEQPQNTEGDEREGPREREAEPAKVAEGIGRKDRGYGGVGRRRRVIGGGELTGKDRKFQARAVPFHASVFEGGQRAGQFDAKSVFGPAFFVNGFDLGKGFAH